MINATSASLSGELRHAARPLRRGALAYDMMYGRPRPSCAPRSPSGCGAACADGLGMLVEQAAGLCAVAGRASRLGASARELRAIKAG